MSFRLVLPNGTICECFNPNLSDEGKNSLSFGLDPGYPPSMKSKPSLSSLLAILSLSCNEKVTPRA